MNTAALLEELRSAIQPKIQHGEFLLSTNTFSTAWIGEIATDVTAPFLRAVLSVFAQRYMTRHPGVYVMATLEPFGAAARKEAPLTVLTRDVVAQISQPTLRFQTALFDPDSFEIELDMSPPETRLLLVIEPSTPHDLLVAVCQHVHMLGGALAALITPVESEHLHQAIFQETFGSCIIPLFVYDVRADTLTSVLDMAEEPYLKYQSYFTL